MSPSISPITTTAVIGLASLFLGYGLGRLSKRALTVTAAAALKATKAETNDSADVSSDEEGDGTELSKVSAGLFEQCKLAKSSVLCVRTDLNMSTGKIAAHHATLACYKSLMKSNPTLVRHWERTGQAKIALKCPSEDELLLLQARAQSLNLCARTIMDAGRTQVDPGTITVLGIGPGPVSLINEVTGKLRLLGIEQSGLTYRYGSSYQPDSRPTPPDSGRSSPYTSHRTAEELESQNDEHIEGLRAKVQILKNVTIGIGNEVRESTIQLGQMNDVFAETGGILSGTFRRMNNMAERQGQAALGIGIAFAAFKFGGQYLFPTSHWPIPIVDLDYSVYEGLALPSGQNQFLGIRFASPPLGDLRFRRPQPPLNTTVIQSAKEFGPVCYALGGGLVEGHSEDCLFLNIWAPSDANSKSKLPVFFWIQGGGYNVNSQPNYNGSDLVKAASNQVVFVALNYRVGPFGFLTTEKVRRNGDLNAGLLDQRFALEWVQKHITKFGGDPGRVVLVGASAGAGSIAMHMLAYGGQPTNLFHGVIGISPFLPGTMKVHEREWQFDLFASRAGCSASEDPLACLRSKDSASLQKANIGMAFPGRKGRAMFPYPPAVDGDLLQDFPQSLIMQDKFVKVPAIFGIDTDEGTMFTPNLTNPTEVSDFFLNNFHAMYDKHIHLMNLRYPLEEKDTFPNKTAYFSSAASALGDVYFVCPSLMLSRAVSRYANSWKYRYNVLNPADYAAGLGVAHTSEMHNLFGPGHTDQPEELFNWPDISLTPILQAYYTNFVRFLDPNAKPVEGSVLWPEFKADTLQRLVLQTNATTVEAITDTQLDRCELWRKLSSQLQQ